jgi:L-rhamnose-H+ transport protein
MTENIGLGLGLVLLGGVLQGSFALPLKRMPAWRWENTWLVYSFCGMIALPWVMVLATVPHFGEVLHGARGTTLAEVALFGLGWGVGATLFGLGISRVGMALSFAIVLGITASLGSLLPLLVLQPQQLFTPQGYALVTGLVLVILGIVLCSVAGRRRERELSVQPLRLGGTAFRLGLVICILSGIFSAMLNFSFVFGKQLQQLTLEAGAKPAMASNLVWALALSAGFLANGGYCTYLSQKNHTWGVLTQRDIPASYWLGAMLMGIVWFFGIAAYGMGATDLGALGAVLGWPVFMAMNIITANIWGAASGEWKGASSRTYGYSWAGIAVLLIAIYVISRGSTS